MDEGGGGEGRDGAVVRALFLVFAKKFLLKVARAKCSVKSRQPGLKRTQTFVFISKFFSVTHPDFLDACNI